MTNLNLAMEALQRGDVATAESICVQIVEAEPNNAEALSLLGNAAIRRQDRELAKQSFRRAALLEPERMMFQRNLVRALMEQGEYSEAERHLRELIARASSNVAGALEQLLLMVLMKSGKTSEAIALAESGIQREPSDPQKLFILSELYRRENETDKAISTLKEVIERNPQHTEALNNLAGLQMGIGDFMGAMRSVQALLKIDPEFTQAYCNLASLLAAAGDVDSASTALQNALRIDPSLSKAKFQLVNHLIQSGELERADQLIEELMGDPHHHRVLVCARGQLLERRGDIPAALGLIDSLSDSEREQPDVQILRSNLLEQSGELEKAAEILEDVFAQGKEPVMESSGLHFSLGHIYDKLGRYDEAFREIRLGNDLRRNTFVKFDREIPKESSYGELLQIFAPDRMQQCPDSGLSSEVPIFVVGMPRSGTTLTEQILGSHPEVYPAGELTTFRKIMRATYLTKTSRADALTIVDGEELNRRPLLVPKNWENITADELQSLGLAYLESVQSLAPEARRIVDKMPYNFFVLPLIHKIFPNARIIHCRRHPLDTCLSCFFQNFNAGSHYTFDLQELGRFYRDYWMLMKQWRDILNLPMFEIQYEDLIKDTRGVVGEMLDYCGLPWDERCLASHKTKRVVNTASYQQVRKPIYSSSKGRWRNYAQHLLPLIQSMGINEQELMEEDKVTFETDPH